MPRALPAPRWIRALGSAFRVALRLICGGAVFTALQLQAARVETDQALDAAVGWRALSSRPMGRAIGDVRQIRTVRDDGGAPLFHVVDLAPAGFAVLSADDEVECVVAFASEGSFVLQAGAPLYDLLRHDLPGRLEARRAAAAEGRPTETATRASRQWARLLALGRLQTASVGTPAPQAAALVEVSDVRVQPMVETRWNQDVVSSGPYAVAVYNYYTPPYGPGSPYNYYTGCVATGLAQIVRFHRWPEEGVGTPLCEIGVDGWSQTESLRGGNGTGGPYDWANMIPVPTISVTPVQQQAIGALLHDVAVAINTSFSYMGSYARVRGEPLRRVFRYRSAAYTDGGLTAALLATRTNLDAGLPVGVEIWQDSWEGHVPVCDGYGYNGGTLYHHLNMGWGGNDDAWYNLPTVDDTYYGFNLVRGCVYNISPDMTGEIISGRIAEADGTAVAGVSVVLRGPEVRTARTNARGIFVFKGVASNTAWTLVPQSPTHTFTPAETTATTGSSQDLEPVGDRLADFGAVKRATPVVFTLQPQGQTVAPGGSVTLVAAVTGAAGAAGQWARNGVPLVDAKSATLSLAGIGPEHTGTFTYTVEGLTSAPAIVGLATQAKVVGAGTELSPADIHHQNGNIFDQVLVTGAAEAITADPGQVTRTSFVDANNDIVQVEFSGPGTLSLVLAEAAGPARPAYYHQDVYYMKGTAGIVITGATENTNVSIFSVGRRTAVNQDLFRSDVTYEGRANIAFIAIESANGRFGGVRTANAVYGAKAGLTGVYAPGVAFSGPVYVGNIAADGLATPVLQLGSAADVQINGGDLRQLNGAAVQVAGMTALKFRDGLDSHGRALPAQHNRAVLQRDGTDVTTTLVVGP